VTTSVQGRIRRTREKIALTVLDMEHWVLDSLQSTRFITITLELMGMGYGNSDLIHLVIFGTRVYGLFTTSLLCS
jgi:hypothetical protein